jgi:hypothetical protein
MANPTNPFNWQMPTSTDLVTDLPADFEVFGQAVATSMADLLGGTTGQVLSKASNTNMDFTWVTTDDANAIQNSIVDAKGDIIAASANDTPARLAVGANGETLVADSSASTGLKWAKSSNFVGCTVFDTSTQTIANNTATAITFGFETIDTDGFHSTTTNTSRLTIPAGLSGKFLITINTLWDLNGVGIRNFNVRKNGATFYAPQEIIGSTTAYVGQSGSAILEAVAGDYFELFCLQTSGGNLVLYKRESDRPFNLQFLGA